MAVRTGHVECPLTWQLWGELTLARGELQAAVGILREAVSLRQATATTNHRGIGLAQLALATALCRGEADEEGRGVLIAAKDNLKVTPPAPLDSDLVAAAEAACHG